jgi:hypothetical protein
MPTALDCKLISYPELLWGFKATTELLVLKKQVLDMREKEHAWERQRGSDC